MKIRSAFPGPIAFCALLVLAAAQGLAAGDAVPATAAIAVRRMFCVQALHSVVQPGNVSDVRWCCDTDHFVFFND
jgi:hypothetical protein